MLKAMQIQNSLKKLRDTYPPIVYGIISVGVLGDLLFPGYVLSLDMVFTPEIKVKNLFYGFDFALSLQNPTLPILLILKGLSGFTSTWVVQKTILFLILFLAGVSAHRLCPTESEVGKFFAGSVYMLNPFVYVRFVTGQWTLLMAYALTPFVVKAVVDLVDKPEPRNAAKTALLTTLATIFTVHYLFLTLFILIVFVLAKTFQPADNVTKLAKNLGLVFGFLAPLNIFWALPALTEPTQLAEFSYKDLQTFTARTWGIGPNIFFSLLSMHGFWRAGYRYITEILPYWYLIFVFILFLAIHGFVTHHDERKIGPHVKGVAVVGVIAVVLGAGISTPYFSDLFEFLFNNVFFFKGFRDSQKFVALLALTYSYLGGLGIADLYKRLRKKKIRKGRMATALLVAFALASPFVYSLNMLGGFGGELNVVDYPNEWHEVDGFLNKQEGDFKVLFFPWHWFMAFSWSGRVVANPASVFFDRPVIQGENIEVGTIETQSPKPTQHYIHFLLNHRDRIRNFGELVAFLNVKYVILAKEVDYREYDFLYSQQDLKVVLDNPKMTVFENQHKTAKIYWVRDVRTVNSWEELLEISKHEDLMDYVYIIGGNSSTALTSEFHTANYTQISPVKYRVETKSEGYLIFTEPYSEGWILNGEKPLPNLGLTNVFPLTEETYAKLYFEKFKTLATYYLISLGAFTILMAYLLLGRMKVAKVIRLHLKRSKLVNEEIKAGHSIMIETDRNKS